VPYACIDIGSNTIRLLVAELEDGRLRELLTQRAYAGLGRASYRRDGIPPDKIDEIAETIATQAGFARELGSEEPLAVATAAIRNAPNQAYVVERLRAATGVPTAVLSEHQEARLAFLGATRTLETPLAGDVAVIDVGGGSSEIVVGPFAAEPSWSVSLPIGSGLLAEGYLRADPPAADELERLRIHVEGAFEGLDVPTVGRAIAVGGSAASLRRVVGAELDHETLERAIRILGATAIAEVAARFELDPARVRVLPAGILLLEAIADLLGVALTIGRGGLREGTILELAAGRSPAEITNGRAA
jgi:exopolyphosphatase/guanosine-5'-triphosphate,3'-diphosphate pyrophosphatase